MKAKKILYFDTETTGLISVVHEIISISGIIEIEGKVVDVFDFYARPDGKVSEKTLELIGFTLEQIKS